MRLPMSFAAEKAHRTFSAGEESSQKASEAGSAEKLQDSLALLQDCRGAHR